MACVSVGAADMQRFCEAFHFITAPAASAASFLGKLAQFGPFSFGIMPNAVDGV